MQPDSERELLRHGFRLDALDEWRQGVDRELATIRKDVGRMSKSDEIAAAVAQAVGRQNAQLFTRAQKLLAGLTAGVVAACSVVSVILQVHG